MLCSRRETESGKRNGPEKPFVGPKTRRKMDDNGRWVSPPDTVKFMKWTRPYKPPYSRIKQGVCLCVCARYGPSAELSHESASTAESKWQLLCLTVLSADHTSPIPRNIIKAHLDTRAHAHTHIKHTRAHTRSHATSGGLSMPVTSPFTQP